MKFGQIVAEEAKKEGIELAEETLKQLETIIFVKALPRVVAESDNASEKGVAGFLLSMYPALKPAIEKAEDLNHDGKVGVV